jgi:hypothetical protein
MKSTTVFYHLSLTLGEAKTEIISDSMQVKNIYAILWYAT